MERFVGVDVGAETVKVVELVRQGGAISVGRRLQLAHGKAPGARLVELLAGLDWPAVAGAAVTGRLGRSVALPRVPTARALMAGHRHLHGDGPATLVTIGARGFQVIELHQGGRTTVRENSRCAQGTGNFLRQLVERLGLGVEEACRLAEGEVEAAPLSGRCPVILKTDMTHLANKGEPRERILAGLLEAVAENVAALIKPGTCPRRVFLGGGVARAARVRAALRRHLERHGMALVDTDPGEALFQEALGAALHAAAAPAPVPALGALLVPVSAEPLETLPPPSSALSRVRRLTRPPHAGGPPARVVLGLDIGSTGSKAVALDTARGGPAWEGYLKTGGDPVGAAQALVRQFLASPLGAVPVAGVGVTGSGREIVGSLLASCLDGERVFVLNEIAAHAAGAVHADPRVDTIFEIGGQDAKYIRLEQGRVVDAAMNEACSAGTGSFIEEQGRSFEGVDGVAALGALAMGADGAVALGQHCSVFMAEVIDEAVARGAPQDQIVAGLYESVVANYLNRVKGSRSVGQVVFCQGMPFAADALAAAVVRQTGAEVIVPPSPGTVGALGIALLAAEAMPAAGPALRLDRLLEARVERKDVFVCAANSGCGGEGARCRVDRLTTLVSGQRRRFSWGGACALHDGGTRRHVLPDLAPDPFREREALVEALVGRLAAPRGGRRVALTDEFQLKGLFPFFATYLHGLGLDLDVVRGAGRAELKRGLEAAHVPFCAPMQQHHGTVAALAARGADFVFQPMLRELPRVAGERASQLCPVVQAAPDLLAADLGAALAGRLLAPVVDVGPGRLDAPVFLDACRRLAGAVGVDDERAWRVAWRAGREAQAAFDEALLGIGRQALARCQADGLLPVVVVGRSYTIHNEALNSNVPAILRQQGAIAIPLDCFPVPDQAPLFENMFWGHGQRILRAAWQVRRTPGLYALYASNYSCGPDSFTLHFFGALMEGKPFAVIETDGHAGDAGTRTRVEAFLHCAREDRRAPPPHAPPGAGRLTVVSRTLPELRRDGGRLLLPPMGPQAQALAAVLRGVGVDAQVLPDPTRRTLQLGRRHTSGKECLPAVVTLGGLLERLEREEDPAARFTFLMPGTDGPCRFGAYKELHQLVLDRLGLAGRVRIWSPPFGDYFQGIPSGAGALVLTGVVAIDLLRDLRYEVAAFEPHRRAAELHFDQFLAELTRLLEREAAGDLGGGRVLREAATGRLYGVPALLRRAGEAFGAWRGPVGAPRVLVVGEIYLRNEPFSSGFVADALARRGIVARVAPVTEFLQYSDHCGRQRRRLGVGDRLDGWVRRRIETACHAAAARAFGWHPPAGTGQTLHAAASYLRDALEGETVLTVGAAVEAWRRREVDGVLSVGPLECMPNKLAESLFHHAAAREGLLSLTLSLNGDPVDPEALDAYAFEIHARHRARGGLARPAVPRPRRRGEGELVTLGLPTPDLS